MTQRPWYRSEYGAERTPLVVFTAITVLLAVLVIPAYLSKRRQESEIRLKAQLRSFHSANEAYRARHAQEGYASGLDDLVRNPEKIRYINDAWIDRKLEHHRLEYLAPDTPARGTYALMAYPAAWYFPDAKPFCVDQRGILHTESGAGGGLPLSGQASGCTGGIEVV